MSKDRDRKASGEEQGWRMKDSLSSELRKLKTCPKHPGVQYEGLECPGCAAEREFLLLTDTNTGDVDAK
jgi:hypothetical protein